MVGVYKLNLRKLNHALFFDNNFSTWTDSELKLCKLDPIQSYFMVFDIQQDPSKYS
ncbi:hypothetical protein VCRA2119O124_580007 [Vibrio crassostreae]|nr:hypothetical protein VCRA2119O124_580007 [Vibrio crassostreae]